MGLESGTHGREYGDRDNALRYPLGDLVYSNMNTWTDYSPSCSLSLPSPDIPSIFHPTIQQKHPTIAEIGQNPLTTHSPISSIAELTITVHVTQTHYTVSLFTSRSHSCQTFRPPPFCQEIDFPARPNADPQDERYQAYLQPEGCAA